MAEARGDRRATWQRVFGKGAGNSLETIAFSCQHTTDHDRVRKVLIFASPGLNPMLPVCTCELSVLPLGGEHFSERVCINMP